MIQESKAYKYCEWCLEPNNDKVGIYVKLQAASWKRIADGEDEAAYVDEKMYEKVCKLLKIMVHPDLHCSVFDGLERYAWLFIVAIIATRLRTEDGSKIRYYHTAVLEIARKNFKTFNSAIIFIILMLVEPAFSRFFSVAPDLQLSSELKLAIRKIIKVSPELYDEVDPAFKILRSEIDCLINDNVYIPLAYSEDGMDGKLPNAFLADEAGALDEYPVEAMRSGQITLLNKLGIIISTQYPNDNNVMIDEIDIAKKTLDGLLEDKRTFALLYEPDDELKQGDIWQKDERVIYQANPVATEREYIFEELKRKRALAVLYKNKRENFLCKHCNIQYKGLGVEGFIDITKVKECVWEEDINFWKGKRVFLGLDLSMSNDNTSVAMITYWEEKVYTKVWGFIPKDLVEVKTLKEHVDYQKLIDAEVCYACGDEVIDYTFIEDHIMGLEGKYGVVIVQIAYDKWNALSSIQKLEAAGYECVEVKQHSSVLHMPTKWLLELILKKNLQYAVNRMLEINFQNARCTYDTNLNRYVNKKKSAGKVDMVVSLINAVCLLLIEILGENSGGGIEVL